MALRIAVVGMSPTCADAPWDDPTWQKWGLPWHDGYWARMDRHFEMHDMRLLLSEHSRRDRRYMERIRELQPYMQTDSQFGKRYPFEEVAKTTGAYWNSSIAYALALAIHERADEIGIFGVDMKGDDEYGYQKPNCEYLIGLARGLGIKVHVPEASPLLKFTHGARFYDHVPAYIDRYGWLG